MHYSIIILTFAAQLLIMSRVDELMKYLKRGQVYRRTGLAKWSKAIDRHLDMLVDDGTLQKVSF